MENESTCLWAYKEAVMVYTGLDVKAEVIHELNPDVCLETEILLDWLVGQVNI